jgi:hypothetical protein
MPSKIYTVYRVVPISEGGDRRVYIGSTGDLQNRIRVHRRDFNLKPNLQVYRVMRENGSTIDSYRFEIVAQFDSKNYPEGGARRLAKEMEGALIRELVPTIGCLNINIANRTQKERVYELYHNDPKFRKKCIQQSKEYRETVDPEQYRAAGRVRAAKSYARKKAARLANINKSVV